MLELLPKKNKPSFEELYSQWFDKSVQYIYKKIGNLHDAEDLASEVFVYCYSHYDSYDPAKSSVSTWLFMVINSRIKNHYRDNKTDVDLDSVSAFVADDRVDMDECLYTEQLIKQVEKAINRLPERKQQVIRLRFYEEKTSDEIAQILDITPGNARVLLSRAIGDLEKMCADFVKED